MFSRERSPATPTVGLVLTGGGARAAYQVGVLRAVADMLPHREPNPFPVICGTSAGAINATYLACHAARFATGVRGLELVWRDFSVEQVYRADARVLTASAMRWLGALFFSGIGARHPESLLDNAPLRGLLARTMRLARVQEAIDRGLLRALSVTCSSYTTGESVDFFQAARERPGWRRARRLGRPAHIGIAHLMASSAIPAIFPPVRIGTQYYGDGAVRQLAPVSPALHLGADRVLVIGVGERASGEQAAPTQNKPPSVAEIAGHLLDSAFLDSLEGDLERLHRVNRTLALIPEKTRRRQGVELRPVDTLVIEPSRPLSELAWGHVRELPRAMRFYLRGSGANERGAVVTSYLLFERGFCREAMAVGYRDAMAREGEILRFLGYDPARVYGPATGAPQDIW